MKMSQITQLGIPSQKNLSTVNTNKREVFAMSAQCIVHKNNKKYLKCIVFTILLITVAAGFTVGADKQQGAAFYGHKIYHIASASMEPEYQVNALDRNSTRLNSSHT